MKPLRKYWHSSLSFVGVSILRLVSKRVSLAANQMLGSALGGFVFRLRSKRRRVASINLKLCFPEKSPEQRLEILEHHFLELGKMLFEIDYIWHIGDDQLRGLVKEIDGEEVLLRAQASDRGTVFATAHLGSFEVLGRYLALDAPLYFLYKSSPFACVNRFVDNGRAICQAVRCKTGLSGVRQLLRACESGGNVIILPDQVPPCGRGVRAPFFGHPAYTMTLLGKLAQRAPVVFAVAERLPQGRGYCLRFFEAPGDVYSKDPVVAATAINRVLESFIRRCPHQYWWLYKRFKRTGIEVYRN